MGAADWQGTSWIFYSSVEFRPDRKSKAQQVAGLCCIINLTQRCCPITVPRVRDGFEPRSLGALLHFWSSRSPRFSTSFPTQTYQGPSPQRSAPKHNTMRVFHLISFLALALLTTACFNYSRFLAQERGMLNRVSRSNLKSEQKLDSLLASSIRLMETALKPIDPTKGGKLVAQYFSQNQSAMESIATQLNGEFSKMNLLDQGLFTANVVRKPYARQFTDLYPKFKKKYQQVQTAAKFLGFFGKAFGKLGKLADLLG